MCSGIFAKCHCLQGLVMVTADSQAVVVLTSKVSAASAMAPGSRILYANDLDFAADGTIYFSDSSQIPPALNDLDFYDTFRSYFLTQMQVVRSHALHCQPSCTLLSSYHGKSCNYMLHIPAPQPLLCLRLRAPPQDGC